MLKGISFRSTRWDTCYELNNMIIAVSAAPIVDTSDISQRLSDKYSLAIQDDPAPEACAQFGFQTIYEMPAGLQSTVRESLIRTHLELVNNTDTLLLNYSVFGWIADWMRWCWSSTPTERWEEIVEIAAGAARRYEHIYHVENNVVRPYDGYIWLDRRNSRQINNLLKYLYHDFDVVGKVHFEFS
jgi:hypothetical protein